MTGSVADRPEERFGFLKGGAIGLRSKAEARFRAIVDLKLAPYVAELDAFGYTVIPPELVGSADQVERIKKAVVRVAKSRFGIAIDDDLTVPDLSKLGAQAQSGQILLFYLLFEGPEFEEWLDNPVLLALVDYFMRGSGQLSSMISFVKWKGGNYGSGLGLHSDSPSSPEGVIPGSYDFIVNAALVLSPYTRENGAIAVVPGSHNLGRQPQPGEGVDDAIPVEAPVGSLIFWRGGIWHGAYPKLSDGYRLNLTTYFVNRAFKTQERYGREHVPPELLAGRDERYARILGMDNYLGWDARGPEGELVLI